jgi:hypothetical protein
MFKAFVRGLCILFNTVVAGATVVGLMIGLSAIEVAAAEDVATAINATLPAAPTPAPADTPVPALTKRVVVVRMMAPIPDSDEKGPTGSIVADSGSGEASGKARTQSEAHCLATAIYFEARGESLRGQRAVAEVILARTRVPGRPKTICGVVYEGSTRASGCQFSFTCDRIPDVVRTRKLWLRAQRVAAQVMRTRGRGKTVSRGATFYHADYVSPSWASRMVKVAQIGQHVFYKPKRGRLF